MMIHTCVPGPRSAGRKFSAFMRKQKNVFCLLFLSLAYSLGSPVALAQAQLRADWVQDIQNQQAFVGILSREEGEDIRYIDIYIEAFSAGMSRGTEVHRVEINETVELFTLPVAEGIDCYEVGEVIGLDRYGKETPGEITSTGKKQRCSAGGLHHFETASHVLVI